MNNIKWHAYDINTKSKDNSKSSGYIYTKKSKSFCLTKGKADIMFQPVIPSNCFHNQLDFPRL